MRKFCPLKKSFETGITAITMRFVMFCVVPLLDPFVTLCLYLSLSKCETSGSETELPGPRKDWPLCLHIIFTNFSELSGALAFFSTSTGDATAHDDFTSVVARLNCAHERFSHVSHLQTHMISYDFIWFHMISYGAPYDFMCHLLTPGPTPGSLQCPSLSWDGIAGIAMVDFWNAARPWAARRTHQTPQRPTKPGATWS